MRKIFKTPRLPKVPDLSEARQDFRELNKFIRDTRREYMMQCWSKSEHLVGKRFWNWINKAVVKAVEGGLYAESTGHKATLYSFIHFCYKQEVNERAHYGASYWWRWVCDKKKIGEQFFGKNYRKDYTRMVG
jgi:hypothetical protein